MKVRNGFVSNSSSSSFIVYVPAPTNFVVKSKITLMKINKLRQYGFKKKNNIGYEYDVTCNQQEVIDFLTNHRIPFIADEHHDHYCVIYNGGDYYHRIANFGNIVAMYGKGDPEKDLMEHMLNQPLIQKILIKSVEDKFKKEMEERKREQEEDSINAINNLLDGLDD